MEFPLTSSVATFLSILVLWIGLVSENFVCNILKFDPKHEAPPFALFLSPHATSCFPDWLAPLAIGSKSLQDYIIYPHFYRLFKTFSRSESLYTRQTEKSLHRLRKKGTINTFDVDQSDSPTESDRHPCRRRSLNCALKIYCELLSE